MNNVELRRKIEKMLYDILDQPGAVLVSGVDTLTRGDFYVMGFNPGGDPKWVPGDCPEDVQTIRSSLANEEYAYNDWTDKPYRAGGNFSPLQRRIQSVFEALRIDPRRTFSTNALFTRSRVASKADTPWQLWWEHCWPVHQVFIAAVQPRVIVCLGNGPDPSTWEFLRLTKAPPEGQREYKEQNWANDKAEAAVDGKWRPEVLLDVGGGQKHSCSVLGLPHPSARNHQGWPLNSEALRKISLAREAGAQSGR